MAREIMMNVRAIWLHLALAVAFVMAATAAGFSQDAATTIYIVRHAEKADDSADAQLAPKGDERARDLAHVLHDAGLNAIFVSGYVRTQKTAEPIARASGLTATPYKTGEALVKDILDNHVGDQVLVVAHSGTVDDITAGLGVNGVPELKQNQYDRLFVVLRIGDKAYLNILRYGEPTD